MKPVQIITDMTSFSAESQNRLDYTKICYFTICVELIVPLIDRLPLDTNLELCSSKRTIEACLGWMKDKTQVVQVPRHIICDAPN